MDAPALRDILIWSKTAETPKGAAQRCKSTGWPQLARPSLCDEASAAMQEHMFSAQLFCGISVVKKLSSTYIVLNRIIIAMVAASIDLIYSFYFTLSSR